MRVYIICPVRILTDDVKILLDRYVAELEANGVTVHYPPRDVDQDDPIGLDIMRAHREAMREADQVHVYWAEKSEGSRFDLGMAFALGKPIRLINRFDLVVTPHKSFANIVLALDDRT
jgi:nucleoside 2-deoxyribosyltransferase